MKKVVPKQLLFKRIRTDSHIKQVI